MAWQYDVKIEGVAVDIEYTADSDIETGESWIDISTLQVGGVDITGLVSHETMEEANKALLRAIADDERDVARARRIKRMDRALGANPLGMLGKLGVTA